MAKTNKSYAKRLKLTKGGRILSRKGGINHFNAKKSRSKQMEQKRPGTFVMPGKVRGRFLGKL